jgi:hypothetical protein
MKNADEKVFLKFVTMEDFAFCSFQMKGWSNVLDASLIQENLG